MNGKQRCMRYHGIEQDLPYPTIPCMALHSVYDGPQETQNLPSSFGFPGDSCKWVAGLCGIPLD